MKIQFLDMKREAKFLLKNGLLEKIESVISSGQYLFGENSKQLEEYMSEKFNSEAILVGSGTDAITISLMAYGINQNSIVGVPAFSAIPTAVAVKMTGAKIRYVDLCKSLSGGADLKKISHTDAFIPVYLYGNSFNIEELINCKNNGILVVEDCAQAFGTKINNNFVGTFGHTGAFSFYPSKNLGCFGDGGLIITKDSSIAQKIRELRFYGQKTKKSMSNLTGMNSRIDEIQCAILLNKLIIHDKIEERRLEIFDKYVNNFKEYTIKWNTGCMPHLFPIFVKNRNKFIKYMKKLNIEVAIHYPFTLPASIDKYKTSFPIAEKFASEIVSLPFYPWLNNKEIQYIIESTKRCLEKDK